MKKYQGYLNEEKDKELIEWIASLGIKESTVVRNALIYLHRASVGLHINPSPYTGVGTTMTPLETQINGIVKVVENDKGKPDKEFENIAKSSLKGLLRKE